MSDRERLARLIPNPKEGEEYFFGGNPGRAWIFENGEWKLKEHWFLKRLTKEDFE